MVKKDAQIGARIDADLKEQLERMARAERRSVANMLEVLILEGLMRRGGGAENE